MKWRIYCLLFFSLLCFALLFSFLFLSLWYPNLDFYSVFSSSILHWCKKNWFMGCTTFSDLQSRCNNTSQNSTDNCFQSLAALSSSVAWFSIYTFTQHKWHVRRVDPSLEEQRFQGFKKHKDRGGVRRSGVREKVKILSTRAICVCQGKHSAPAQGQN